MTALARAAVVATFTFLAMPSGAQGSPASAAVACPQLARAQCTTVTVPLDRSGATPGSVNLAVARVPAPQGPSRGTILFLAGGPGESALASLPELAGIFAALAPGYDLLTFDQRGTGRSSPLFCPSLRGPGSETTVFARCGARLGPARGFYRTSDSVDDIEAVRQSIGSPQVGLLGVSYGGRVGGEYVRRYPGAVSRMVLDSPSTLEGTDPFTVSRQQAVPRVLRSICGRRSCRSFTRSSASDLRVVGRRLARKSLRTSLITPRGGRVKVRFGISDLYALVALTDLDPVGRAQLPGALAAARRGDGAALARA
ncbi:MAG: alpha/beta fold hydrolase, partial [Thermoleophilaceae bacterium]|nr:alpha/beta fold hydrolase [Thermoleophilaceae bacterium]